MTLFNNYDFDDFWDLYDKKVCRVKCEKKWNRLPHQTRSLIMEKLPLYIESTPTKKWRKNPETYLNNECWNDEVIFYEKARNMEVISETVKAKMKNYD